MSVYPSRVVEGLHVFENQGICLPEVNYPEPAEPFPLYQGMEGLDAGIVPGSYSGRIASLHPFCALPVRFGHVLAAAVAVDDQGAANISPYLRLPDTGGQTCCRHGLQGSNASWSYPET